MKVFVLMYYNYDDTDYFGVFSSKEAAEGRRTSLIENSKHVYVKSGKEVVIYNMKKDYFEIIEEEV